MLPRHRCPTIHRHYVILKKNSIFKCLRIVIPVAYIRTIVDQWSRNSSQIHSYIFIRVISSTNFNAQFNNNMYVTLLSSTCLGPWHAHPQEEQLHKHSIWYPRSSKRLYTTPVESGNNSDPGNDFTTTNMVTHFRLTANALSTYWQLLSIFLPTNWGRAMLCWQVSIGPLSLMWNWRNLKYSICIIKYEILTKMQNLWRGNHVSDVRVVNCERCQVGWRANNDDD